MAFQFRYQRVLDIRELEEDREKAHFAELQQNLTREKTKLNDLNSELDNLLSSEGQRLRSSQNIMNFRQLQQYIKMIEQKIIKQQQVVEQWQEKLEDQREQLIEASQRRQVMEKLKENDFEEFQEEMLKEEERRGNEIAGLQYFRRQRRDA